MYESLEKVSVAVADDVDLHVWSLPHWACLQRSGPIQDPRVPSPDLVLFGATLLRSARIGSELPWHSALVARTCTSLP